MDEIINKSILLSGIEDKDNKISLMEQTGGQQYPTKYSFFKQTQAGEPSKAFTQYQEMGVSVGKVYTIAVKETQGVNKMSGKPVTYRNIAYFITGGTQTTNPTKNTPQVNSVRQDAIYDVPLFGLNKQEANEIRIIKQAIIKSSIEGGQIQRESGESEIAFVEKWIKYVYKNTEADKKLTEQDEPF